VTNVILLQGQPIRNGRASVQVGEQFRSFRREGVKENAMTANRCLIALTAIFLLLPLTVFARSKDTGSLNLVNTAKIGTTQLKPGNYKVEWNGNAGNVNVNVLEHNKSVATLQAKLVELPNPSPYNSVQTDVHTNQIQQIDFGGRRDALVLKSPK
jgi:hypothetical protein